MTRILAVTAAALLAPAPLLAEVPQGPKNLPDNTPAFAGQTRAEESASGIALATRTVADGLDHPWGIAVLPDAAGYLVTERSGALRHISADGTVSEPLAGVPEVFAERQGGLLDIALAEDFADSRTIYLTYSKPVEGGSATAAARATLSGDMTGLTDVQDIFVQQPAADTPAHYGSRITPQDGMLWITTGERFTDTNRQLSQDLSASYGKVIRVNPDGTPAQGNPFADDAAALPEIWSYGHRNIQGDAVDAKGRYWTIEHGPEGGDELNLPEGGKNYGWPVISYGRNYDDSPVGSGKTAAEGMEQPVYYWDPVIAPGDMVFYDGDAFPDWQGDLIVGSLTPGGLNRLEITDGRVSGEEKLLSELGRVRDVEVDADGTLLVLTDFDDGALIRIQPEASVTD